MGVLNWITQGCDALTATASPTIDALGVRMCIALATIMLVWFGVQESLASTHGGQGFHMGKFLSFFMLITFAYTLVRFYDSSIPGVGQSFRGFINGGAQYLVSVIGNDSITTIQNTLNQAQATSGPGMVKALMNPYYAIVYVIIQVLIETFSAVVSAIVSYGAIARGVTGLLGPVFIPFLVFNKLEFLFWGWLRAFIGFCFYKVLAAAVFSIRAGWWGGAGEGAENSRPWGRFPHRCRLCRRVSSRCRAERGSCCLGVSRRRDCARVVAAYRCNCLERFIRRNGNGAGVDGRARGGSGAIRRVEDGCPRHRVADGYRQCQGRRRVGGAKGGRGDLRQHGGWR